MDRRSLLKGAAASAALPLLSSAARAQAPAKSMTGASALSPLAAAARDAWIYGLALVENAATRQEVIATRTPANRLLHMRGLTTPKNQFVTTPNNDTLYSRSWLNLSNGPVRVTLPRTGTRYISVAFMDMYANNFAILGTRTTGGDGGTFTIVGPQSPSNDPLAIRSPTPWVWMLIRVLVDGDSDLPAANQIQNGFRVDGPAAAYPTRIYAKRDAPWDAYFETVQALIVENPPPATDARFFAGIAPLGLGAQGGFDPKRFGSAQRADIEAGVAAARTLMRTARRQGAVVDGWIYPKADLGDFGQDYLYRAQVALGGLGALTRVEAMYMRPLGADGRIPFDSAVPWVLRLPADRLPPVDSFWSLTMYQATDDGQFFFFDNPINRYAIGDRTPGLVRDPRGGIDIYMTRDRPAGARAANWLPTPPSGRFGIVFRAYLPRAELLDGLYALPALERLG